MQASTRLCRARCPHWERPASAPGRGGAGGSWPARPPQPSPHPRQARNNNSVDYTQCFIWSGSGSRIFRLKTDPDPDLDPIRIKGFDDQKFKKIYRWKFTFKFSDQKLQITYLQASIKDVQATGETFRLQKENIQHFKTWDFSFFSIFVGHLRPPESGSEILIILH